MSTKQIDRLTLREDGSITINIPLGKKTANGFLKIAEELDKHQKWPTGLADLFSSGWRNYIPDTFLAGAFGISLSLRPAEVQNVNTDQKNLHDNKWFKDIESRLDKLEFIGLINCYAEEIKADSGFYSREYYINLKPLGEALVEKFTELEQAKKLSRNK